MISFTILKKSKKSLARLGILETSHGAVETPTLVPVATQATVKTLTGEQALATKTQILIANTFHLHLRPGEKIIQSAGGLHRFANWPKPFMTDSGGYQVFSLGFGRDFNTSKIIKQKSNLSIKEGHQPKFIKITDDGVLFRSPLDGRKIFLGPRESMKIQEALGADIIFAFDECPSPLADYEYVKKSLIKTHQWAKVCLEARKSKQALFGIVQGGKHKDLRVESARLIGSLDFDGFGIGGEFGAKKSDMARMLKWVMKELPEEKPRHLLGIGYLEDIPEIIKAGVDLFDCTVPTHYARRGFAFTSSGKLDLRKSIFLKDKKPLDARCRCATCQNYKRNYICHLFKAGEITAFSLLTSHNLYFFHTFIEKIRNEIKKGKM